MDSWYTGHCKTRPCSNTWNIPLYTETHREIDSQMDRKTDGWYTGHCDTRHCSSTWNIPLYRQTHRDRQTYTQTDRQTQRDTHRQTHTDRKRDSWYTVRCDIRHCSSTCNIPLYTCYIPGEHKKVAPCDFC